MTLYCKQDPHPSHVMGEWRSTIVTLTETSRYGEIRKCVNCGCEQARTVAGVAMEDELKVACPDASEGALNA